MSAALSAIPVARRRRAAATLGLIATLFVAVGAVAATARSTALVTVFVAVAFVAALVLALLAWGVARSIRTDRRDVRIDAEINQAIEDALAAQGSSLRDFTCGCGHDHDPDELRVTDDPCAHDGAGHECSRTCDTCVFARLERTAAAPVVGTARPRPRPRPTPH